MEDEQSSGSSGEGKGHGAVSEPRATSGDDATQAAPVHASDEAETQVPAGAPPKTSRWRSGPGLWALIAAGIALIVVISLVTVYLVTTAADQQGEVFLEPAAASGDDPFSPNSFAPPQQPPPPDPGPPPAPAPQADAAPGAIQSIDGSESGVFGGTMNQTTCDAEGLINYLGQNPDRARAWASVFRIPPDQIPAFIRDLTPVLLRADTRVTDHQYVNGRVVPKQAVLEQGTAVLVNKFGEPTVRCYSGNPLLPPVALPVAPAYVGPANYVPRPGATGAAPVVLVRGEGWPGFTPTRIIVIRTALRIIDVFRLWDPFLGGWFWRFPGIVIVDLPFVVGVVPVRPPGAPPRPQGSSAAPWLRGTYAEHNEIQTPGGHYSNDHVTKMASDCPGCNATEVSDSGTGIWQWNGPGWTHTGSAQCGPVTSTLTPTVVVNGIVQEATGGFTVCDVTVSTTWTRTGD